MQSHWKTTTQQLFLISIVHSGMLLLSEDEASIQVGPSRELETSQKQQYAMCDYNGRLYPQGKFQMSACVWCECTQEGVTKCWAETCPPLDPHCIQYDRVPGECCPICLAYGCMFNGTLYHRGANIDTGSPCRKCYCPWSIGENGGETECIDVHCPPVNCVDARVPTGKCCPVCQNGKTWSADY